jgi:hypothetical protein
MTKQHRATLEQWDSIERCADGSDPYSCIIELRARIEALEAAQQPLAFTGKVVAPITRDRDETGDYIIVHDTPALNSSLVERVTWLIVKQFSESRLGTDCTPFGRDVIREVAAWLRSEYPRREGYGTAWANLIEQEANR